VVIRAARHQQPVARGEIEKQLGFARFVIAVIGLDGVQPGVAEFGHQGRHVAHHARGMRQRCHAAGLPYARNALFQLRFAPEHITLRRFIQVLVEGLPVIGHVTLLDHDLGEVRPPGHAAPARLGFLERDIHAQLAQALHQPDVAVAPGSLHVEHPLAEAIPGAAVEKIAQQMNRMAVELGGEFDAAHQVYACRFGQRNRLVVSGQRVVVGYG